MSKVVLKYSALYFLLHCYFLRVIRMAFPDEPLFLVAGCALGMVMLSAPILVRELDRLGFHRVARGLSLCVTPWMALLVWFCTLALGMEVWNLAIKVTSLRFEAASILHLAPRPAIGVFALIIAAAAIWSLWEASHVRLERITVRSPHLKERLRLLHISDLHLSVASGKRVISQVFRLMEKTSPDLIVSTGDLVDGPFRGLKPLARRLARVRPPLGKYAVLGNHEFYNGLGESLSFLERAGFSVIRGESVCVGRGLRVVGVDDPVGHLLGVECWSDESEALPPLRRSEMTVLLKHRPTMPETSRGRFDLQLSGHTHGGQLSSDRFLLLRYPLRVGFRRLNEGGAAYVSRGTGTWGPPMRLFSPPEVTLITLEPASSS